MKPLQTTQFELHFTGPFSPWCLLILLPLVVAAVFYLYRIEFHGLAKKNILTLLLLRAGLLCCLVFLAFKPNFIHRVILKYPGRILFLLDDSRSMEIKDTGLTDAQALRMARSLGSAREERVQPFHQMSEQLWGIASRLRAFELATRGLSRSNDLFWEQATKSQEVIVQELEQCKKTASTVTALTGEEKKQFELLLEALHGLRSDSSVFFSGEKDPGKKSYERFYEKIQTLAAQFQALQGTLDQQAIAQGNAALRAEAERSRARTRLDLVGEKIEKLQPRLTALLPNQICQTVSLVSGKTGEFPKTKASIPQATEGSSDIIGRLESLLDQANDFPLAAIVLVSDGRDLSGKSPEKLAQSFSRKQVPIYSAGVGSPIEPIDLAFLKTITPPIAVAKSPLSAKFRVKAAMGEPKTVRVELLQGTQTVATTNVLAGATMEQPVELRFTPPEVGLFRYSARLETMPGEVVPTQNNSTDFVLNVRQDKTKVLFLDWKPRWETRFAMNILRNMDYVDLNSIVVIVGKDATLKRGVEKGTWPENLSALEMYDLVILGDLPPTLLTPAEWDTLRIFVQEKGKTLCFIGPGSYGPYLSDAKLAEALLPLKPRAEIADGKSGELQSLDVSEIGRAHPLTKQIASLPDTLQAESTSRLFKDTQSLLLHPVTHEPLMSCRFIERGKTHFIDVENLWKLLNPTQLRAHASIYEHLVTWSIEGGFRPPQEKGKPSLAVDQQTFSVPNVFQLWGKNLANGSRIEAVDHGTVIGQATLRGLRGGSNISSANFTNLPPKEIVFQLKDDPSVKTPPVMGMLDDPELRYLARNDAFLQKIAAATGGESGDFFDLEKLLQRVEPRQRIEKIERVWRPWDSVMVMALLIIALTVEWVWRKWIGLI